ncbi:MAG: hypothetical protein CL422_11900 [Acidimicrobiaceae bacterium]|nr:hypothetical protein [Acidimicrobiaceae bacterium]MEC8827849.1 hypothetical protein [Actinomycetota bacterium]MEC8975721.1 hypothetical protein [Actinomycetota bacterium]|tara:strand:- start:99 stop:413 length:315 start_codon:yes stop_codon:yes gene_type:complete
MDDDEILEGELVEGPLEESMSRQVEALTAAGLISEEIEIFDLAATEGPAYEIEGLTVDDISEITHQLDKRSVRWVIDTNPQLLVHRNDERKADEVFDLIFGPEE